jgi:hypothetical protein
LAAEAAFALGNQGFGHPQFLSSLVEGLSHPLGLTPVVCEAFLRLEAPALSGFGLLFGVSLAGDLVPRHAGSDG